MSACEDDWEYDIDLNEYDKLSFKDFECRISKINEMVNKRLEESFTGGKFVYSSNNGQFYHEEDLRNWVEKNKNIQNEIESRLEAISSKQGHYETLKKDQKLLSQKVKERHEAFLMAKKYYKKLLKMYHTIESRQGDTQTIFIQFFTESKKDSENYSVRLIRNAKTSKYSLSETTPKLPNIKEFQRKLEDTNDVPGALCSIRQHFMTLKNNKKTLIN